MIFLPDVADQDYANLRVVMGCRLPGSYSEWIELCSGLAEKLGRRGFVLVPVRLSEFANFVYDGDRVPDLGALLEYCAMKGAGQRPRAAARR